MTWQNAGVGAQQSGPAARRERLRRDLATQRATRILVTDLTNIRYLTGFTGSNAALLIDAAGDEKSVICTDGRYLTQIAAEVPDLPLVWARDCAPRLLNEAGAGPILIEDHAVTVAQWQRWQTIRSDIELVAATGTVAALREVKDAGEIDHLRRACAIGDQALAEMLESGEIAVGRSERAIARALEFRMLELGAEDRSFESIVAGGPNSAIPHHQPADRVLVGGDLLTLDFGALVAGYHSDMTRTLAIGEPAQWQREIYELVAEAAAAGRKALVAGAGVVEVDNAAREVITEAGYEDNFVHGLGHGVGLEIHEAPGIGAQGTGTLLCDAVVTVEPGVYLSGRGGVRIEDTLVVRPDGPELLTHTTRDLIVV
ncbi:M24 family metallopeptidase [Millisia brevis]|uniref:M24 family metallopeptidase n=1 Tax=Millisia brevis TaxID=264148 RepID=UPI00083073D8|nr:Xaa-Pro peptidase family protein [Millisia brevis]